VCSSISPKPQNPLVVYVKLKIKFQNSSDLANYCLALPRLLI